MKRREGEREREREDELKGTELKRCRKHGENGEKKEYKLTKGEINREKIGR